MTTQENTDDAADVVVRKPGSLRGRIWMAPGFDETPEDYINLWYDGPVCPE